MVYQDEIYLEQVRAALSPVGYDIFPASSSSAALAYLQRNRPRVVVVCPRVPLEVRDSITAAVGDLHPGLTVLLLSPNHIDKLSDLLQ